MIGNAILLQNRKINFQSSIVTFSFLLCVACNSGAESRETAEEQYYKHLLFSNNSSQKTYFSKYFFPQIYFEDECVAVGGGRGAQISHKLDQYRNYEVSAVDIGADPAVVDLKLNRFLQEFPTEVPKWAPKWATQSGARLKDGNANFVCNKSIKPQSSLVPLPEARYIFTKNLKHFLSLWRRKPNRYGFRSPDRNYTPSCYVEVTSDERNMVKSTSIYLYAKDFSVASFQSAPVLACLVRGTIAGYGVPGILSLSDAKILRPHFRQYIGSFGDFALGGFWRWEPMASAKLYDGPGWTWPQVQHELRYLKSRGVEK